MNQFRKIKATHLYFFLFAIAIAYIFSLYFKIPDGDEGIIAEWAYWLAKDGVPRSVLYTSMGTGTEQVIYVYHKLITWFAAVIIHLVGMELLPLRFMIFCFLLILVYSFKQYTNLQISEDKKDRFFLIATLILLTFSSVFHFSFIFRPEIMVASLGFLSFLFLYKTNHNSRIINPLLAGFFAGLSFLTHLNGIAFLIAGFALLLWNKNYKAWILYSLIAGCVSIFIFIDDISPQVLTHFLEALQASPDTTNLEFVWYGPIQKLINEHQRFFHSPVEASLSLLFLLSLILAGKSYRIKHKLLLRYFLILVVALGSLTHGKTPKYFILVIPYMVLFITHYLFSDIVVKQWKFYIFSFFLFIYFIIQSVNIGNRFKKHHSVKNDSLEVLNHIPKGSKVMGNSNLVFPGVSNYELHANLCFEFIADANKTTKNLENYLMFAHSFKAEYVVFTNQYRIGKYWEELHALNIEMDSAIFEYYNVFYTCENFTILKIKQLKKEII